MGYRSQVAFVVEFVDQAGRDGVLDSLDAGTRKLVLDAVDLVGSQVRLYEPYIKWYSTRSMLGTMKGYEEIDALETFLDAAEEANDEYESSKGSEGVASAGAFVRLGEEDDDSDTRYWGYNHVLDDLDLSDPTDLVWMSRRIVGIDGLVTD